MKLGNLGIALCLAAAATGVSSFAGEHRSKSHRKPPQATTLRAVAVTAAPGEAAYGWRYFSDARTFRAVVISPNGDYYYGHGEGLELVFKARGTT